MALADAAFFDYRFAFSFFASSPDDFFFRYDDDIASPDMMPYRLRLIADGHTGIADISPIADG